MGTILLRAPLCFQRLGTWKDRAAAPDTSLTSIPAVLTCPRDTPASQSSFSLFRGFTDPKQEPLHPPWLLLGATISLGFIQCSALALTGEKKQPGHNAAARIPPAGLLIREDYEVYCCFSIILNKAAFQNCFRHIRSCTFYTSRDTGYNIFLTTLGRIYFLLPLSWKILFSQGRRKRRREKKPYWFCLGSE